MRRRSVEPAGSRRADLRRGLASPTPTVAAALAGPRLTHNPSRSTVEPENGGYLGDVGLGANRAHPRIIGYDNMTEAHTKHIIAVFGGSSKDEDVLRLAERDW